MIIDVAEKDLGLLAQVVVHAADHIVGVFRKATARVHRRGKADDIEDGKVGIKRRVEGLGAAAGLSSLQIRGLLQHAGVRGTAVGGEERGDIGRSGGQKLRRGYGRGAGGTAAHTGEFGGAHEEELVFDDGTARNAAKLVPRVDALGNAELGVGYRVGCCCGDAVELPQAAVKGVAAGHGGDGNDTTGGAAVLGREIVGNDAVLLHGIQRDMDRDTVRKNRLVFYTIQQDLRAAGAAAIQAETDTASGVVLGGTGGGIVTAAHVAGKGDEVVGVAGERGQLSDLRLGDNLGDFRRGGVDHRGAAGGDFHHGVGAGGVHGQLGIQGKAAADGDHHCGLIGGEAGAGGGDPVGAWFQVGKDVIALGAADRGAFGVGAGVLQGHRGTGNDGAAGVGHGSGNLGLRLGQDGGRHHDDGD